MVDIWKTKRKEKIKGKPTTAQLPLKDKEAELPPTQQKHREYFKTEGGNIWTVIKGEKPLYYKNPKLLWGPSERNYDSATYETNYPNFRGFDLPLTGLLGLRPARHAVRARAASLGHSSFLSAFPFLSQTCVGHRAGRGRKGIGGSNLLLLGPQELLSAHSLPGLWGWSHPEPGLKACWGVKPPPARRELRDLRTHSRLRCLEPAVRRGWALPSVKSIEQTCALKGIPFCLPLLRHLLPYVRPGVCIPSCNSDYRLDCTSSSSRLIHQHCSNSKPHPTQLMRELCVLLTGW